MERIQREWLMGSASLWFAGPVLLFVLVALAVATATEEAPLWPALVVTILVALLGTAHLSVSRTPDHVVLSFWPFARRRIPLRDIRAAQAVSYRPLRHYGGWGIRWGRGGMVWSVAGKRAVRLDLRNGRHVLIGSRNPDQLLRRLHLPRTGPRKS